MIQINNIEYKPCEICEKKAGSYTLCESCYHNRTQIDRLRTEIKKYWNILEIIEKTIKLND